MKHIALSVLAAGIYAVLIPAQSAYALATPPVTLLDWDVAFVDRTLDASRAGLGGFANWARWTYTVTANVDNGTEPGEFTHLGIGLPVLPYVAATATIPNGIIPGSTVTDATAANVTSLYLIEFKTGGGPLNGMGQRIQWNNLANLVVTTGDFNTFSFSTPFAEIVDVELGLKQQSDREYGLISGPGDLTDPPVEQPIPEPVTTTLAGLGLGALAIQTTRRRRA